MKKLTLPAIVLLGFSLLLLCGARVPDEEVKIEKTSHTTSKADATRIAKAYLDEGAYWITIHQLMFAKKDSNDWDVEASFKETK